MEVSELAMQQIGEHQVIYIHDDTVILADGDEEVQYVIPSEMGEEEGVLVQEDEAEHYLMSTRQIEQLQDDQTELHQESEEVEHAGEMGTDEHQILTTINDQSEVITEVVLNEEQCRMLQGCGRVFLQQGSQRFLLDKDGLREVDLDFNDESEIENEEYIMPADSEKFDDPEDLIEEDQEQEESSEYQNDTQEGNVKNQHILQHFAFHQESFEEDMVSEEELSRAAILSHIKLENVDVDVPKEKQVYSRVIPSTKTKIASSASAHVMDRKMNQGNTDKRILGKRRQHTHTSQTIERQQALPRYVSQKGKKHQKIEQNSASITSEDIVNLLKANKLDRNGLEQVKRNGKMYIGDTPDGRRIYGRVVATVKQPVTTETPAQDENNTETLLPCDPTLFETSYPTDIQNIDEPHQERTVSSIKTNAKLEMSECIKPNKSSNEKSHSDIVKSVQLNGQKSAIDRVHLLQSKSEDINDLLQSDIKLPLQNEDLQTEDNVEDSEDLENELASIKKVLTTLARMRSLKELLITRALMIIREVNQQPLKSSSYRRESYYPGRMVSMDDDDQSQDNYQFIHMPNLKGAFPEDGYSPINLVDKWSLPCDENFLIIKFIVSTDGAQPTTRIVIMEKKTKTDQNNQETSSNYLDWQPVEMEESTTYVKAPSLMKKRQWKLAIDNKPLECRFCKKTFGRASNLARHMSIHASNNTVNVQNRKRSAAVASGSAMFVCDKCPCAYHFQSTLTRHMISAHRDEVEIV